MNEDKDLKYEELISSLLSDNAISAETFKNIISCVSNGKNKLQQKEILESFVFDEEWIYYIEGALFSIEKIAKAPKSSIIDEHLEVPIEKARKTTSAAVRHLSSHTNRIRGFDEDGLVMPTHLLTTQMEEDKLIYENRFVYSLIQMLERFVEEKYNSAKGFITTHTTNILNQSSEFSTKKAEIKYNLSIEVKTKNRTKSVETAEMMIEKILEIKKRLAILANTEFSRLLSKSKPVKPPIIKTNILALNVDYKNCYKLYLYVSSYNSLGYSVQVEDKNLSFDVGFFDDLTLLTALSLKALTENNLIRGKLFNNIPFAEKKNRYKVINKIEFNPTFKREKTKDEDVINQFYFDKVKEAVTKAVKVQANTIVNTKVLTQSFTKFFKTLATVNRGLYLEVLTTKKALPERKKAITKKLVNLNAQKESYKNQQLLTRLMTRELNHQIKKEALVKVKLEKLNFEYERMLLEQNKSKKKFVKKKKLDTNKYVDKKLDVIVGRRKIVNKTLLDQEYEKERIKLVKAELAKARRRDAYKKKKEEEQLANSGEIEKDINEDKI